jgi:hypothetical protein
VTSSVTSICPLTPAPRIVVTKNCPLAATPRGGLYTYSGTVSNAGNVTLVNIYVVNDQPTNNTPVLGPIVLLPGQSVNYTGSYIAPTECYILDTITVRGQDRCTANFVSSTASQVCPLLTTPSLTVSMVCPAAPIQAGVLFTFNGFAENSGDITLTNVMVLGPQPGNPTPVLGPMELAPGESAAFVGSYLVPNGATFVTVTGTGQCTCYNSTNGIVTGAASCPVQVVQRQVRRAAGGFGVTFASQMGVPYTVKYKNSLSDPAWTVLPNMPVTGTGENLTITDAEKGQLMRFYQIIPTP